MGVVSYERGTPVCTQTLLCPGGVFPRLEVGWLAAKRADGVNSTIAPGKKGLGGTRETTV